MPITEGGVRMPNFNGEGPRGRKIGRGLGNCDHAKTNDNYGRGMGRGMGRGKNCGRGFANGYRNTNGLEAEINALQKEIQSLKAQIED